MKKLVLIFFMLTSQLALATGEASTYFNIFVAPNNETSKRHAAVIVTAIYDSTTFEIIDDNMDGDADDNFSGVLMAGQSYIMYIKDNGINDDARYASGGELKSDGDYLTITANNLVLVSQSTDSDWQHDWVPATNKTSRGQRFIIYAPKISYSNRDLNVMAYDDNTVITFSKISRSSTTRTGYTEVNMNQKEVIFKKTLNVGQDIIHHFNEGQNVMESGHTYVLETSKPVTVQYGALWQNARDGGGYVPGASGGSADELFYFTVPFQTQYEQEIRIVSLHNTNSVSLERYDNGQWIELKNWALDEMQAADWVGKDEGKVTYPTVFRVRCSAGKKVSVLEANWMETGSPNTSDMATTATSQEGATAGKQFLVYMPPPGKQNNVVNPFTGQYFDYASHAYLFSFNKTATVTVKDASSRGEIINRTYTIEPGRYQDAFLNLAEWESINDPANGERPYLLIESDQDISVMITNFNDNWMNYFGSSLASSFKQTSKVADPVIAPGEATIITTVIDNQQGGTIENADVKVVVPNGLTAIESKLQDAQGNTTAASFSKNEQTGESIGTFDSLNQVQANSSYTIDTKISSNLTYEDGDLIGDSVVFSVETVVSGTVEGTFQQSTTSVGIVNQTSNQSQLLFESVVGLDAVTTNTDAWSANWVDFDNDNDLDLFVTEYDRNSGNHLYENTGNGNLRYISLEPLTTDLASSVTSTWGDYDNDGDLDALVANNLDNNKFFYQNQGIGEFKRMKKSNLEKTKGYFHGASWVDIDNNGQLDLLALDFMPVGFNLLYRANGKDFDLAKENELSHAAGRSIGASWSDFNQDGQMDVFVPNGKVDTSPVASQLMQNTGNGRFQPVSNVKVNSNAVSSTWGDYDNDGWMDLFVSNASNQNNLLFRNTGNGQMEKVLAGPVVNDKGNSHGATWLDYNNDGYLDLLVINNGNNPNYLYRNLGNGKFQREINEIPASKLTNAMGISTADYDKDGDLDIFITSFGQQKDYLFRNKGNGNHWATFKLVGTKSNRSAIGARIRVKAMIDTADTWQMREISAQNGIGGQNSLIAHFGLGGADQIDTVVIDWPSGIQQTMTNLSVNTHHAITETDGNLITGVVFHDKNSNCLLDSGESRIGQYPVNINDETVVYTNQEGIYKVSLNQESNTLAVHSYQHWRGSCDSIKTTDGALSNKNYDFAVQSALDGYDLTVNIANTAMRRGFKNEVLVILENRGTTTAKDFRLDLSLIGGHQPVNSLPEWTSQNGTNYFWEIDSLPINEQLIITLADSVHLSAALDNELQIVATFLDADEDLNQEDNQYTFTGNVVGAVDPNDMLSWPGGWGSERFITTNQEITYKIRFQNVGNYYAENVQVNNQLSSYLDVATLQMVAASHDYEMSIKEGLLTWDFKGIKLPDSTNNEPESHGFIIYKIKPHQATFDNTRIYNSAAITFDFEKPIITNQVFYTVRNATSTSENRVFVFPNPVTDKSTALLMDEYGQVPSGEEILRYELINSQGRIFLSEKVNSKQLDLQKGTLPTGVYFIQLTGKTGTTYTSRIFIR